MTEKKRPGVMFYFETRPCLRRLSLEEKGLLLEAALDYAQYGQIPELDGLAGMAWDFIQPRVDRDGERYERVRQARSMAAHKRWETAGEETQEEAAQEEAVHPEEMQEDAVQETQLQEEAVQTDANASDAAQWEAPDAPGQEEAWWEDLLKDANAYDAEQNMPDSNPNPNSNSTPYSNPNTNLIHPISAAERPGRAGEAEPDWEELRRRKIGMLTGWMPAAQSGTKPPPGGATALDGGEKSF